MTKTTFFLMLTLWMLSVASVNAQVRIGGLDDPNPSAILDLNATDATDEGTLGLALPRVKLISTTSCTPLESPVKGMVVYNTATTEDVTPGTYYNDGAKWLRVAAPNEAFVRTFVCNSEEEMLALDANQGDICIRADLNGTFILRTPVASTLSNWEPLLHQDRVQSVNAKTGIVTLSATDVGLNNVNNTSDSDKNVNSAAKLTTARTIAISGGATGTATSFDGSANITIPVTALDVSKANAGTLPIARGGTGATSASAALSALGISAGSSTVTVQDGNYGTLWKFSYNTNRVVDITSNFKKILIQMKCTAVGSTGSGACLDAVPSAYSAMGFMTVHTASFTATTYRILKFANESCWVYNPTGTSYAPTASMGIAVGTTIFINLDCWN